MTDILTQNFKLVLPEIIAMQYKTKTPKTLATRDSRKFGWRMDGRTSLYDNTLLDDHSHRGGKNASEFWNPTEVLPNKEEGKLLDQVQKL